MASADDLERSSRKVGLGTAAELSGKSPRPLRATASRNADTSTPAFCSSGDATPPSWSKASPSSSVLGLKPRGCRSATRDRRLPGRLLDSSWSSVPDAWTLKRATYEGSSRAGSPQRRAILPARSGYESEAKSPIAGASAVPWPLGPSAGLQASELERDSSGTRGPSPGLRASSDETAR